MKGQYKIIFEVLLVLAGIIMTSFIITNFQGLEKASTQIALRDGYNTVANDLLIALVKASVLNNTIIRIDIPDQLAGSVYRIHLEGDEILVASTDNPSINVTRQIFNIGQPNRISPSDVISSARSIEVVAESGQLRLRRGLSPDLCVILGAGC